MPSSPTRTLRLPICMQDLHKRKLSRVDIPSNNGSVVADGLRGVVQRSAPQQIFDKVIALGVCEPLGARRRMHIDNVAAFPSARAGWRRQEMLSCALRPLRLTQIRQNAVVRARNAVRTVSCQVRLPGCLQEFDVLCSSAAGGPGLTLSFSTLRSLAVSAGC